MEPDAQVVEGFQTGLMLATLKASDFYSNVSAAELKTIVGFLSSQKGEEE
jgi:hypothetical protein